MRISFQIYFALVFVLAIVGSQKSKVKTLISANDITRTNVKSESVIVKSSVPNALARTLNDFHSLIRTILDYFSSSPIRDETLLLIRRTVAKLSKTLETFASRILDATEEVAKEIFLNLRQKLNGLEDEFQDLSRLTDEKFERVIIYVNNTMMEQSVHMETWATNLKRQLRSMNDTALYRKLCPAIDELIKETTDELSGCCNIVIKPVKSICRSVRAILRETFHVVADVVETVENCIFSEERFDSMVISCLEDIYDDVSALMERAAALRHTLMTKLPTNIMLSNFCISMVSVTMATRKSNVEQQIEYLNN